MEQICKILRKLFVLIIDKIMINIKITCNLFFSYVILLPLLLLFIAEEKFSEFLINLLVYKVPFNYTQVIL